MMLKTPCDRLLSSFMLVAATVRDLFPSDINTSMSYKDREQRKCVWGKFEDISLDLSKTSTWIIAITSQAVFTWWLCAMWFSRVTAGSGPRLWENHCNNIRQSRAEHRGTGWRCLNLIKEGPAKAWHINYKRPHDYIPHQEYVPLQFLHSGGCGINGYSNVNQRLDDWGYDIKTFLLEAINHVSAYVKSEACGQRYRVDAASPPVAVRWQKGERHTSKLVTASWDRPSTYGPRTLCSRTFRDCRLLQKQRQQHKEREEKREEKLPFPISDICVKRRAEEQFYHARFIWHSSIHEILFSCNTC